MVFIPFKDFNPRLHLRVPYVTWGLIALCVGVFAWQSMLDADSATRVVHAYAAIPAVLFGTVTLPPEMEAIPPALTLVTSMFLHGDFWHLAGNMLFLWVFGDNIEDALGSIRYLLFYLCCGIVAGLAHAVAMTGSTVPMLGASGAISGVIAAYLILFPKVKVLGLLFMRIPVKLPAWSVLGLWVGYQFVMVAAEAGGDVAWWAHVGGILAGLVFVLALRVTLPAIEERADGAAVQRRTP